MLCLTFEIHTGFYEEAVKVVKLSSKHGRTPTSRTLVLVILTSLLVTGGLTTTAQASTPTDPHNVRHVEAIVKGEMYSTKVSLNFKTPITQSEADTLVSQIHSQNVSAPLSFKAAPLNAGPAGAALQCNTGYDWWDTAGNYGTQRYCGGNTAGWHFKINAYWKSHIIGYVHEYGMMWTLNGAPRGMQAPHTEPSWYVFHGNYGGLAAGNKTVSNNDVFGFVHNLRGGGEGTITVHGSAIYTNTPWH